MSRVEKSALPSESGRENAQSQTEDLSEEFHALLRQVGSPDLAPHGESFLRLAERETPFCLGSFLEEYLERFLLPHELPAIVAARRHAERGEFRELLAQDQGLVSPLRGTPLAEPSRRIGRLQMARLRPLRDNRLVQRYLSAVESGRAHGWHTVVYGITLAVFSLPLRQGLLHYCHETLAVLASAATRSKKPDEIDADQSLPGLLARLPEAVEAILVAECH